MAKSKEDLIRWLNTVPDNTMLFIADTHFDGGPSLICLGSEIEEAVGNERRSLVDGAPNDNGGMASHW
jgi:hypothetical protein